jgi:hypothetical protein
VANGAGEEALLAEAEALVAEAMALAEPATNPKLKHSKEAQSMLFPTS